MSRAAAEARGRVVRSAAERMRRHGVDGTSMLDAVADAQASRGSLYHYFPGGKTQLIEEATALSVAEYTEAFETVRDLDMREAAPLMLAYWRDIMESSDFQAGCPVAAAALSGDETASARALAASAFDAWGEILESVLRRSGVPAERTPGLAVLALAAIEGAVVVSLAHRSTAPMERVADELLALVEAIAD